jgi:hypothetical protein
VSKQNICFATKKKTKNITATKRKNKQTNKQKHWVQHIINKILHDMTSSGMHSIFALGVFGFIKHPVSSKV